MEVRLLEEKDLTELLQIFTSVYKDYSMYNINLFELYRHFADEPQQKEYMVVVEDNGTLLGYAAFGIRTIGSGIMVSLYDVTSVNKKGADLLIKTVEEIGVKRGAAFIEAVVPAESDAAAYVMDAGFLDIGNVATMVYVVFMKEIVRVIAEHAVLHDLKKNVIMFCVGEEKIVVDLCEGAVYSDDKTMNTCAPDVTVTLSLHDLLSLLCKKTSFFSLVLKRRVKINPVYKVMTVWSAVAFLAADIKMVTPFMNLM